MRVLRRVGILGGTFDPPHQGHLAMARLALEKLELREILFVPVRSPSHKREAEASFEDRVNMVSALIASESSMRVSRIESTLGEKSYTVPMLEALRRELGTETELFFLIGADSLSQLHLWHRYRDILRLARVVAFPRPGYALANAHLSKDELDRVEIVEGLDHTAASRECRGGDRRDVPPGVRDYISERGLYGSSKS